MTNTFWKLNNILILQECWETHFEKTQQRYRLLLSLENVDTPCKIQWGSDYWTYMVFKWSNFLMTSNCCVFWPAIYFYVSLTWAYGKHDEKSMFLIILWIQNIILNSFLVLFVQLSMFRQNKYTTFNYRNENCLKFTWKSAIWYRVWMFGLVMLLLPFKNQQYLDPHPFQF